MDTAQQILQPAWRQNILKQDARYEISLQTFLPFRCYMIASRPRESEVGIYRVDVAHALNMPFPALRQQFGNDLPMYVSKPPINAVVPVSQLSMIDAQ